MTTTPALLGPASSLSDRSLAALRGAVAGPVLVAGDPALTIEASPWNLAVRRRPDVVVGAASAGDVAAAVRFARQTGRPVVVQATGHGAAGVSEGTVLVTTSRLCGLAVDAANRRARVGAGVKWGAVITEAARHGLAPLSGSSTDVGAVGYTLGGGLGSLGRRYGFAADLVRALEVVTADGEIRTVDPVRHPDLFWGLRGGKGSFGIVTQMEIDLVPVSSFYAGSLTFLGEHAAAVLHAWRQWAPTLPESASTSVALLRLPDVPAVPEPLRGRLHVSVRFAHVSSDLDRERLLAPLRGAAPVLVDDVRRRPYTDADAIHRDPVDPTPSWSHGALLADLPATAVEEVLRVAGPQVTVPIVMVELRLLGGALARQPEPANAVAGRHGAFSLFVLVPGVPGVQQAGQAVTRELLAALQPSLAPGGLVNFASPDAGRAEVERCWSDDVLARLRALKAAWDPDDVLSRGHVVRPATVPVQREAPERPGPR